MTNVTYTVEIVTTSHQLIEIPAGSDEADARELYGLCEASAQPGAVECLALNEITDHEEDGYECSVHVLASG